MLLAKGAQGTFNKKSRFSEFLEIYRELLPST
jgi:hypothetical protein